MVIKIIQSKRRTKGEYENSSRNSGLSSLDSRLDYLKRKKFEVQNGKKPFILKRSIEFLGELTSLGFLSQKDCLFFQLEIESIKMFENYRNLDLINLALGAAYAGQMLLVPEVWLKMNVLGQTDPNTAMMARFLGVILTTYHSTVYVIFQEPRRNQKAYDIIGGITWGVLAGLDVYFADRFVPSMLIANAGIAAVMSALYLKESFGSEDQKKE